MDDSKIPNRVRFAPSWNPDSSRGVEGLVSLLSFVISNRYQEKKPLPMRMVEVGCWAGESTSLFAATGAFESIVCVDRWNVKAAEELFVKRLAHYGSMIRPEKSDSVAYAERTDKGEAVFDLAYIDADHTYEGVKADIEAYMTLVRRGGYLCGHDYSPNFPGVVQAVNEFIHHYRGGDTAKLHRFCDSSWLIQF